jgi:hypothetical protein
MPHSEFCIDGPYFEKKWPTNTSFALPEVHQQIKIARVKSTGYAPDHFNSSLFVRGRLYKNFMRVDFPEPGLPMTWNVP